MDNNSKDVENSVNETISRIDELNAKTDISISELEAKGGASEQLANEIKRDRIKLIKFAKENSESSVMRMANKMMKRWA